MKKSEITRKKILDGAIKLFEEKGFTAATTKEIAKSSQVSEGAIYRYYSSKDELLKAIALDFIRGIGEQVIVKNAETIMEKLEAKDLQEKLKALIMDRITIMEKYSSHINILMVEVRYDADIRKIMIEEIYPRMTRMMNLVLEDAKRKGEIRNCDNATLTRGLMGSIITLFMQKTYIPNHGVDITIEKEVGMIVDLFMNGIKK